MRHYRDVVVIRRYGPVYPGYGYYRSDDDAYRWLAFTAITLKILDNLNEAQERAHEQAQAEAATAPVGDTIYWNQSGASGAVSVLRDGYSASGRYCREFQQEVTIGGGTERAYGTGLPTSRWLLAGGLNGRIDQHFELARESATASSPRPDDGGPQRLSTGATCVC
jgi:hypothetical protein